MATKKSAATVTPLKKTTPATIRKTFEASVKPVPDDFPIPEQPMQRKRLTGLSRI
jgi:hypothetical protein